jgi:hypothetical protein
VNWKRGLFRVWEATTLLWAALWIVLNWSGVAASLSDLSCLVNGGSSGPWCKYHLMGDIAVGGLEDPLFLDWAGSATHRGAPTSLHPAVDRARLPAGEVEVKT